MILFTTVTSPNRYSYFNPLELNIRVEVGVRDLALNFSKGMGTQSFHLQSLTHLRPQRK